MPPHQDLNGWPSWPQLFAIVSSIETRLGGLQTGQAIANATMRDGFNRLHERMNEVQDRVTSLEVRQTMRRRRTPSRLKRWKELAQAIAPVRELVALAAALILGLLGLAHGAAAKAELIELAARLARLAGG